MCSEQDVFEEKRNHLINYSNEITLQRKKKLVLYSFFTYTVCRDVSLRNAPRSITEIKFSFKLLNNQNKSCYNTKKVYRDILNEINSRLLTVIPDLVNS